MGEGWGDLVRGGVRGWEEGVGRRKGMGVGWGAGGEGVGGRGFLESRQKPGYGYSSREIKII